MMLSLTRDDGAGVLSIADDGVGLPEGFGNQGGLGMQIMRYRASVIGGTLELQRGSDGGTVVSCRFPLRT
jgi:signal transduction histidine kinase